MLITRNKYPVYDGGALFFRRSPTKNMDNAHWIFSSKNFCVSNFKMFWLIELVLHWRLEPLASWVGGYISKLSHHRLCTNMNRNHYLNVKSSLLFIRQSFCHQVFQPERFHIIKHCCSNLFLFQATILIRSSIYLQGYPQGLKTLEDNCVTLSTSSKDNDYLGDHDNIENYGYPLCQQDM